MLIVFNIAKPFFQRRRHMQTTYKKTMVMIIAAIAVLIFGTYASADWGMGYGPRGWGHHGPAWWGDSEYGPAANLSADQVKKLEEERAQFFDATKSLRQEIYQKRLELASEMAKQKPDAGRASALQKEISDRQAQLAQQRLEHIFRVRQISPDLGRGFPGKGFMGPGMMHWGMMGPGGFGRPDCPYGGPGGGYGMGPGMMGYGGGPGMMGPGRDDTRQYHMGQQPSAE